MDNTPILRLVQGSDEVDLLRIDNQSALAPVIEGLGAQNFAPHKMDRAIRSIEDLLFVERYTLNLKEPCADDLARESDKLIQMLRQAWLFNNDPRYGEPVYLYEQARNETNPRYALVWESPDMQMFKPIANQAYDQSFVLSEMGVSIARGIWRESIPGDFPSALSTFTQVIGGATAPNQTVLSNHYDDHAITHIYVDDGGAFGANLVATAAHSIFPAVPVANDAYYVGADEPFFNVVWNIGTAGDYNWDVILEIWTGAAWTDITPAGAQRGSTIFPDGDEDEIFKSLGLWVITIDNAAVWAKTTVNGQNKYWFRIRLVTVTATVTVPANADYVVYNQRRPYIEIPASELVGPVSPILNTRYLSFHGGDDVVNWQNISLLIAGAKSRNLSGFDSHLNCGGDGLPAGWAVAYDADTSAVSDTEAPGGDHAACTYAADETLIRRVRFTGTGKAASYVGDFRAFLLAQQIGGAANDVHVKLRIMLDGAGVVQPQIDTPEVDLQAFGVGYEIVDLSPGDYIKMPFADFYSADDLAGADLILEVHSSVETGPAATSEFIALILIPVDEWACEYRDPITNSDSGSSALRGLNLLSDDAGIIHDRALKMLLEEADGTEWIAETWNRRGPAPFLDPAFDAAYRIYFIMGHFAEGQAWGSAPHIATTNMGLVMEYFHQNAFMFMRGDR